MGLFQGRKGDTYHKRGGGGLTDGFVSLFGSMIFRIGVFRPIFKLTPIDSPRRELQIRFLNVKNGYELMILRRGEVLFFPILTNVLNNDKTLGVV